MLDRSTQGRIQRPRLRGVTLILYERQPAGTVTEQTNRDREFFQLVVEKETTRCWSWLGDHDEDGRPVFRGDKAYRVMYRLRVDDVPERFHVHHKCENSACVNPRHLVALSPEAHRAVHATKDHALKERIYRGEWRRIKTEKALAEQLARERRERQWREQERLAEEQLREYERLAEEQRQRVAAIAAEEARKREERRKKRAVALRKLRIYGTPVLACELALYCVIKFHWLSEKPIGDLMEWFPKNAITALIALTLTPVAFRPNITPITKQLAHLVFSAVLRQLW
jgi:hypothetical protein